MQTINPITLERLKNAEHVQFHTNIRTIVEKILSETIGLDAVVMTNYTAAIAAEQDIVNMTTGSSYTPQMQENDTKRDIIFKRVRRKLELCELEDTASVAYKARNIVQKQLLAKYPNSVTTLPYQEETAVITGFVQDCRAFLTAEQLEGIRIDADLDDLLAINQKFSEMYQGRVDEKAANDTKLSLKLRAVTDEAYGILTIFINAQANDPTPANAAKAAAATDAIQKINVVIRDAKARLEQRKGGNTDAEENENKNEDEDENENSSAGSGSSNPSTGSTPSTGSGGNNNVME